ncbi:MAG: hypothetical protein AAFX79_07095 [Planctomycetota bacterium]
MSSSRQPVRLEAIQVAAWAAWSGALLVTGATAYFVFTLLKQLDPQLPAYAAYEGEHWKLLGGFVAERLFVGADVVGFLAIVVGGLAFAVACWRGNPPARSWVAALRALAILAMVGLMTFRFAYLDPAMQADLDAYRAAAAAGETEAALQIQARYDGRHSTASTVMVASLVTAIAAFGFTLATSRRVLSGEVREREAAPAASPSGLQEPALLKGRRP